MRRAVAFSLGLLAAATAFAAEKTAPVKPMTTTQVMESAQPSDWRRPDPANTLYLELAAGRVVIELAPRFAPQHVANIKALVAERFFDGLAVGRVQDNFVAQWGDDPEKPRPNEAAKRKLPDESTIAWSASLPFIKLPDADGYAPEAGWIDGFPVGVERKLPVGVERKLPVDEQRKPAGLAWMAHCYGTLGVGRDNPPDTGSGAELYVVIGQAPRQLDRNIVVAGRVLRGIEHLATLPRGTGALGFYEKPEQRVAIKSVRLASELPEPERVRLEVLRTDTPLFAKYVESRRNRRDDWYIHPAGHIDICNVTIPVRDVPVAAATK
jgi:peptidylprolyl isomerase